LITQEFSQAAQLDGRTEVLSELEAESYFQEIVHYLWLGSLPKKLETAIQMLLRRESFSSLSTLLKKVLKLESVGILEALKGSQDESTRLLYQVADDVLKRYQLKKQRQGVLDFDDLEKGALRALMTPEVQTYFHRRFDLILVDEFQDTNLIQAKIIELLARPKGSNLCVVGDPKQSIYRFRDADVSVFEEFCKKLPLQFFLTKNYRSQPQILQWTNQICAPAFADSQMPYEPLIPTKLQQEKSSLLLLEVHHPEELAIWLKNELRQGTPLENYVLLLRKIRGNEHWIKALRAHHIPLAIGSGGLFWNDPRIREMVAFLEWWMDPQFTLSGAIFFRAPWMKISDQQLDQWVQEDSTFLMPFLNSSHPVAFRLKMLKNASPAEVLLSLLASDEIEKEIAAPLLGLWHRLEEYASKGFDFYRTVLEVSKACQASQREPEIPPPLKNQVFHVLTLHSAKGLEFSRVILVDFPIKPRSSEFPLLYWDRNRGVFLASRSEDGKKDQRSALELEWRNLEQQKNLAESKRLFYVALTRAKDQLIFVQIKSQEGKNSPQQVFLQDHWRAWINQAQLDPVEVSSDIQLHEEKILKPSIFTDLKKNVNSPPLKKIRYSAVELSLLTQCARAYQWTYGFSSQATLGEKRGQELGKKVHLFLEGKVLDTDAFWQELQQEGYPIAAWKEWISQCVWMHPQENSEEKHTWVEFGFELAIQDEILIGRIDRLIGENLLTQPVFTLLDFKLTRQPQLETQLQAAYQMQMEIYARAVQSLEPRLSKIQAYWINFHQQGVSVIPVQLGKLEIEKWLQKAVHLTQGKEREEPQVGEMCQHCLFQSSCREGRGWLFREAGHSKT